MNVSVIKTLDNSYDTRVIGLFEKETVSFNDKKLEESINYLVNEGEFKGKFGEIESIILPINEKPNKFIFIGLGERDKFADEKLRKIVAKIVNEGNKIKSKCILIEPMGVNDCITLENATRIIAQIPLLVDYKFDKYQKVKKESTVSEIKILCKNEKDLEIMRSASKEGSILAKETVFARDLVNEPANALLPVELANRAKEAGDKYGFDVEIYDEEEIKELNMQAYMEVAKASDNPPRLIVMRYWGDAENKENIIGIAGKGITYDSGGLCIKTKAGMVNMKADMGGAAALLGAMSSIAELKVKANVVGVIAACENMISGKGYRTGDIIGSMAGKTIFVGSTDAEGRLTLVDAIHYLIEKENATKIFDIATLTGGAVAALGKAATPVMSNDDEFFNNIQRASDISGEKIWRMPCFDEYKESIKSYVADLTNSGGHPQVMTAGVFIEEFVQDKPWIHIDIAATSWADKKYEYGVKGGTGVGVRTLYHVVKNLSNK
ncbi:leucyl aminopeptidase [Abyssisolibacter fermentans]|uniref:leucyl aminopeptidase n=1 Tax=Abyssisolibacter fermentans TaxID=1766203 RepID=UPI0008331D52|nr:leucyl aminopeptidase [Abyssisolibacter fermentans]